MHRRRVLALVSVSLVSAGCMSQPTETTDEPSPTVDSTETPPTETSREVTPTESPSTESVTATPDYEDIDIQLYNDTRDPLTVEMTLTRDDELFLETQTTVGPDSSREVYTGITETGDYHLTVSVGELEDDYPVSVEEYSLLAGTDIIVMLNSEIEIAMQE